MLEFILHLTYCDLVTLFSGKDDNGIREGFRSYSLSLPIFEVQYFLLYYVVGETAALVMTSMKTLISVQSGIISPILM